MPTTPTEVNAEHGLKRNLGLFDSTMIVAGSMIGSGIFIVSADMGRNLGSPGWLLAAWLLTGLLTLSAALSYGELAAMMPHAGGQYVYLREAFSPLCGFLYGWTLFMVIQTGTIAAVGVGFARYFGILWPAVSETSWIVPPIFITKTFAISLSSAQLVGVPRPQFCQPVAVVPWSPLVSSCRLLFCHCPGCVFRVKSSQCLMAPPRTHGTGLLLTTRPCLTASGLLLFLSVSTIQMKGTDL